MMAGAFVTSIEVDVNGDNLQAKLSCIYFGGGLRDLSEVSIIILQSDTLAQIKQKIVDAIINEANLLGYSVLASNIIIPAFQKGA
jgi:hypothetical protein